MAHRSRLAGFIIDCKTDQLDEAAAFWSEALGLRVTDPDAGAEPGTYVALAPGPGGIAIEVQKVQHPSRVHLDIESDDVEAEVQRLESLGAKRIESVHTWCVMEAPTGQRFCVIRMQDRGRSDGTTWK